MKRGEKYLETSFQKIQRFQVIMHTHSSAKMFAYLHLINNVQCGQCKKVERHSFLQKLLHQ